MADKRKIDWTELSVEYASTDITLKELAEKYRINEGTVRNHAADDKWTQMRDKHRQGITADLSKKALEQAIKDKAAFDKKTDKITDAVTDLIAAQLKDEDITRSALKVIMETFQTTQSVVYRRHNVPSPKQSIDIGGKDPFRDYQLQLAIETARIKEVDGGNGADDKKEDGALVPVKLEMPVGQN